MPVCSRQSKREVHKQSHTWRERDDFLPPANLLQRRADACTRIYRIRLTHLTPCGRCRAELCVATGQPPPPPPPAPNVEQIGGKRKKFASAAAARGGAQTFGGRALLERFKSHGSAGRRANIASPPRTPPHGNLQCSLLRSLAAAPEHACQIRSNPCASQVVRSILFVCLRSLPALFAVRCEATR